MSSTRHETIKNNLKEFSEYQTDSLFLLIGTNPLPNYVAFRLLAKPECHVYLVHTDETGKIANRLVDITDLPDDRWTKILVKDSNANDIFTKIYECAHGKQGLGLNYTGGTKTMAVHSYRAIRTADPGATFSYLDARSLKLMIDRSDKSLIEVPAGLCIKPSIETLLDLHGRKLEKAEKKPFHPEVCRDLANVPAKDLRCWLDCNLRSDPATARLPPFGKLSTHWANCETIGDLAAAWNKEVGYLVDWFNGKWLEHYTLWSLQQVAPVSNIHAAVRGLETEGLKFENDVVALRGYQLFDISCTTGRKKGLIKQKLFEAYVRARQLGGDEAKAGVVSFAPSDDPESNPARIKQEIEEEWDAKKEKFRVYGVEDLPDLPAHLQEWFNSQ